MPETTLKTPSLASTIDWQALLNEADYSRSPVSGVTNFGRSGASMTVRASSASSGCVRALYYEAKERAESKYDHSRVDDAQPSNISQTLMDAGNALESVVLDAVRRGGVWEIDHNQDAESVIVEICGGVTLTGHADAVATRVDGAADSRQPVIAEVKTVGSSRFSRWQNTGTLRANPEWARQLSIYTAGRFGANAGRGGVMFVMNRDTGEVGSEFLSESTLRAAFRQTREKMSALQSAVAAAEKPPRGFPATDWRCKRCPFLDDCGNYAETETVDDEAAVTPEELARAVEVYAERKPEKTEADREVRKFGDLKEAESVIKRHMSETGQTEFKEVSPDGSRIVTAKISERKAYKADFPALNQIFEDYGVPEDRRAEAVKETTSAVARLTLKRAS